MRITNQQESDHTAEVIKFLAMQNLTISPLPVFSVFSRKSRKRHECQKLAHSRKVSLLSHPEGAATNRVTETTKNIGNNTWKDQREHIVLCTLFGKTWKRSG